MSARSKLRRSLRDMLNSEEMDVDSPSPEPAPAAAAAPAVPMCVECEDQPAAYACPGCGGDAFCKLCFTTQHRKGARSHHAPTPLAGASPVPAADEAEPDAAPGDDSEAADEPVAKKRSGISRLLSAVVWRGAESEVAPARAVGASQDTVFERAKFIPMRLTQDERKLLRLLEATLNVSNYTDCVDVRTFQKRGQRTHEQLRAMCAVLSGLVAASDSRAGVEVANSRDFEPHAEYLRRVFEAGRRHKIINPDKMRTTYAKLIYLLQDSLLPEISDLLGISLVAPLQTVHMFLTERGGIELLKDSLIETATATIMAPKDRSRRDINRDIKAKESAIETLARRYSSAQISPDEVRRCLYSISDNNCFLVFNRDPIDKMIDYLHEQFPLTPSQQQQQSTSTKRPHPDPPVAEADDRTKKLRKEEKRTPIRYHSDDSTDDDAEDTDDERPSHKQKDTVDEDPDTSEEEDEHFTSSLAIEEGAEGARLTHSHERQYFYVLQSLTLWREIQHHMYRLWYLAEQDMLKVGAAYTLRDTGQGLHRVQGAPQVYRAMQAILDETQKRIGGVSGWVGSSVIHLGDHNVPNALMFIDKYTQVPRILTPVSLTVDRLSELCGGNKFAKKYVLQQFRSHARLSHMILSDFFRHAFDGSGADNFFDAGSCIDGRLTSAWNWCNTLDEKPFFYIFLLAGFVGFDGEWK